MKILTNSKAIIFHNTLHRWAEADCPDDLTEQVLRKRKDCVTFPIVAQNVSKKIINFLKKNKFYLTQYYVPALLELQVLVNTFTVWTSCGMTSNFPTPLEKAIKNAIELASSIKSSPIAFNLSKAIPLKTDIENGDNPLLELLSKIRIEAIGNNNQ
ncbi:MAG: hypothetical protein H0X29_01105 [Parachlamydiaceae bacterium]|nr:hypothetical protein [Parachlamydiaceae bacterium]